MDEHAVRAREEAQRCEALGVSVPGTAAETIPRGTLALLRGRYATVPLDSTPTRAQAFLWRSEPFPRMCILLMLGAIAPESRVIATKWMRVM